MTGGGCRPSRVLQQQEEGYVLVDPNATPETKALFKNLRNMMGRQIMFGHQDALAYGIGWKRESGRSDVKDVAGAHPAVYGWELGDLENGVEVSLDNVRFTDIQQWIRESYGRGGVNTISWHMDNFKTGGSSWDTTAAIPYILPGAPGHAKYRQALDRFAEFIRPLKGAGGEPIPIIFRPFHEHTGWWFWWGKGHQTPEQYKELWRFTVSYLRDTKGLHNLLYAYSTDVFKDEAEYLAFYPGDEWVDVIGHDDYQGVREDARVADLTRRLTMLTRIADDRNKVAALTETGLGGLNVPNFWTNRVLRGIEADPAASRIAWLLVWRNNDEKSAMAPWPGNVSADDFKKFVATDRILLENELPDMYR